MKLKYRLVRTPAPAWFSALIPLLAIVVTFAITSIFIIIAGANPFEAYYYFLIDPLTSKIGILEVLVKSTPLILTGAAVTIAFASGYWNIGAEGQLYAGAVAAAYLGTVLVGVPQPAAVLIMLLGGFVAGMLWGLVPAILKVKLSVDEVVTTLLMNYVALFFVSALLNGPWRDPVSNWPQSPTILANTMMPKLFPPMRLHFGFIVGVLAVVAIWFILSRTGLGMRMRSVGMGQEAARFMGVKIGRTMFITALISAGIAGTGRGDRSGGYSLSPHRRDIPGVWLYRYHRSHAREPESVRRRGSFFVPGVDQYWCAICKPDAWRANLFG